MTDTTNTDRHVVTYTYDSGIIGQRRCDSASTAEELANYLLGCETQHGTIAHVRVIHQDQIVAEFEF